MKSIKGNEQIWFELTKYDNKRKEETFINLIILIIDLF